METKTIYNLNSVEIQWLCKADPKLKELIISIGSISYSKRSIDDSYSFLIHEIIEQMLSKKTATKIYWRLLQMCDEQITPTAISKLSNEELYSIGISHAKVQYIEALTDAVKTKKIDFLSLASQPDDAVMKNLTTLRGIGPWTAKMYLIFVLNRNDVLPIEDGAFKNAFEKLYETEATNHAMLSICNSWKPYSSIGARYLYIGLDRGIIKKSISKGEYNYG